MIKLQAPSQIITRDERLRVVRDGRVIYVDGKPIKSDFIAFEIKANIQPINGRELLIVPETDRFKEAYYLFTTDQILVNDRIERCGVNFQVQTVEVWGNFIRSRIMRIDTGPNKTP
jgi:hypothetical protein